MEGFSFALIHLSVHLLVQKFFILWQRCKNGLSLSSFILSNTQIYIYYNGCKYFRITASLEEEEKTDSDRFLEECIQDPTLRDKLSILSRTFKNRKQVTVTIWCPLETLFGCPFSNSLKCVSYLNNLCYMPEYMLQS